MTSEDQLYALAGQVSYQDARRYVVSRGWMGASSRRRDIAIFRRGDHEAVLPLDVSLRDYVGAMMQFARRVAEHEGRTTELVLRDLVAPDVDRHRPARLGANDASLEAATSLLDGVGRALRAAACSTLQPRQYHPRMSFGAVESFVDATRFASTEAGSFVLVIETPIEVEGAAESFGREVSITLMRSLEHIAMSLRDATPDRIVNPLAEDPQVSSNLCEAILRMAPQSEIADLRFQVTWSALRAAPFDVPQVVSVDRSMYEPLERAAAQLRPSTTALSRDYVGFVKELKGDVGMSGQLEGEVVFLLLLEDTTVVRARALLDSSQYQIALVAHAHAATIQVEAELHRVRRGYELRGLSSLSVLKVPVG